MTSPNGTVVPLPGVRILRFIALLCLLQVVAFSLIRAGTSYDGAEQLLYSQSLDWGYGRSQPPLYTWLLIAVQQVFGVTQFSENLLKFGLLFALCLLLWRIAQQLGLKSATAGTVAVSPFLVFEIAWEVQRNYSHTVLLLALVAAFALTYLAAVATRSLRVNLVLGLVLGSMLLTKYNAALFVLALVAADLVVLGRRGVFRSTKALLVPVVAAIVVAPHALWAYHHPAHVLALTDKFAIAGPGQHLAAVARGLWSYVLACFGILGLPALLVAAHRGWGAVVSAKMGPRRVFLWWLVLSLAFGLALVLSTGATHVNVRWMLPLVVAALPVLCGFVADADPRANRNIRLLAISMAVLATAGQWLESWHDVRKNYNYADLVRTVGADTGASEYLISDYAVLANIRLYARDALVLHPVMPAAVDFKLKRPVLVWLGGKANEEAMLAFARSLGACPSGSPVRSFTLRSSGEPNELEVWYLELQPDCPS